MRLIKENIIEIILLIGMVNISIGFFILNKISGFIATGTMLSSLALLLIRRR